MTQPATRRLVTEAAAAELLAPILPAAADDAAAKADAAQSAAEATAADLVTTATAPLLPTAGLDAATAGHIDDPESETNARLKAASETLVAGQIGDPDTTIGAAAGTVFAPKTTSGRIAGSGIAAIGDSITANYGSSLTTGADNYLTWGLVKSGALLPWRGSFGSGGYTLEQIRDEKLPQVLALAPLPAVCVVLGGTNNVPSGTDASVLGQIYETLLQAGVRPIACTIPPRGDSSTVNNNVDDFNQRVRALAAGLGIDLVDFHRVLVDPSTGSYKTGLGQLDGIHPTFLGTIKMGNELAAVLTAKLPASLPPLARRKMEHGNLIGSAGLMLTDALASGNNTAGDGIADNWRNYGSTLSTFSITTDSDGTRWQKVTLPSTGNAMNMQYNSGGGGLSLAGIVASGDVVEFVCRVRTTGFEANLVAPSGSGSGGTGPAWSVLLEYLQTDGSTYGALVRNPYVGHADVDGVIWQRSVVPAGANGTLRVSLTTTGPPASGSLTVEFTGVAVRNLTALGLA